MDNSTSNRPAPEAVAFAKSKPKQFYKTLT